MKKSMSDVRSGQLLCYFEIWMNFMGKYDIIYSFLRATNESLQKD